MSPTADLYVIIDTNKRRAQMHEPTSPGHWRFSGIRWDIETDERIPIWRHTYLVEQIEDKFYITDEETSKLYIPGVFMGHWTKVD